MLCQEQSFPSNLLAHRIDVTSPLKSVLCAQSASTIRRECSSAYPRRRYLPFDGGAYTFGGGNGSRTGSGRIFAKTPFKA